MPQIGQSKISTTWSFEFVFSLGWELKIDTLPSKYSLVFVECYDFEESLDLRNMHILLLRIVYNCL